MTGDVRTSLLAPAMQLDHDRSRHVATLLSRLELGANNNIGNQALFTKKKFFTGKKPAALYRTAAASALLCI
jgi:hypothetical protein